jgi:hypothetical protein
MGSIFRKGSEQTGQSQAMSHEQAMLARQQAGMATSLFEDTNGIRSRIFGSLAEALGRGQLPTQLRSTVGLGVPIMQQEQELAAAKRGIMDTMPRGGLQQRALMELPIQRLLQRDVFAAQRRAIDDASRMNLYNLAAGIATGSPQTAMGGLANAASGIAGSAANLNSLGQQRMAQNQAAQQGIGKALGAGASLGAGYALPAMGASSLGGQKKGA